MLVVAGVYLERSVHRTHARRAFPSTVPSEVEQQSDNFSYSDVEQGRTIFTVRASHATQFREQNRAQLQNVWITVYGREGNRNDNIHTHECSYEPLSGGIRCQGEVQLDIQGANAIPGKPSGQPIQVNTSDLTFNRETGEASTPAPVEFKFSQGKGRGVGVSYSTHDSTVCINHSVEFDLNASDRSDGVPVSANGTSLEIRRNERLVVLAGPATVRHGERQLSAAKITIALDESDHAREAVAEGSPVIRGAEAKGKFSLAADRFEASLSQDGSVQGILADGSVIGSRQTSAATDHFSAAHVDLAMLPEGNILREMTARGGVVAQSKQGAESRSLRTEALRVTFSNTPRLTPSNSRRPSPAPAAAAVSQRIESAETLAPATIESVAGNETTNLSAKKFVAQFDSGGRLDKLLGHSGVDVRRQAGGGLDQMSSSSELVATFSKDGQWEYLDESGNVRFRQGDRQTSSTRARMSRANGMIVLEGSPVLSDSMSRTTAGAVSVNQQSGEVHASGGIVTTYLPSSPDDALSLGAGPAHLSADSLSGSTSSGHVVYQGHARLWQGESVLEAERIELWREDKKMQATGNVVAIFPQASGSGPSFVPPSVRRPTSSPSGVTLWQIRAPSLTYWGNEGKAHLEGGVTASSDQGSLESRTLDAFLSPSPGASDQPSGGVRHPAASGGQQLTRVLAQGRVLVRQGDRRGSADQAEYTAVDQKFVLSGGEPTLTDAATNTTTGRSLTFFVASDTILIDSQEGLRTLTKHRVEK